MAKTVTNKEKFEGAFLGYAIGDAFGYPTRGMTFEHICERFEKSGCLDLAVSRKSGFALFTDATQMMLFTTDGMIWADRASKGKEVNYTSYVFLAYQLWLYTQTKTVAGKEYAWIFDENQNRYPCRLLTAKGMYKNRFSERINIDALLAARNMNYGKMLPDSNGNSDCYGLKRVMSAGLYFNYDTETAFRAGADFAAITHTNPRGYLSAGVYTAIIAEVINGETLENAVKRVMGVLKKYDNHEEVLFAIDAALSYYYDEEISPRDAIMKIGVEADAEKVLAIALFSALLHQDNFVHAIQLSVNHDGVGDVCGALCGGILGALGGVNSIPKRWIKKIQYYNLILDMEESLYDITAFNNPDKDLDRSERPISKNDDDDYEGFGRNKVRSRKNANFENDD